ncbi:MAG: hypothetical protein FWD83_05405, partial [Promicromonosporaceae bacterium]|nr:hypothetical protein [Promicromonosporaceae bacterium]
APDRVAEFDLPALRAAIWRHIDQALERDPAEWAGYVAYPSNFVWHPASTFLPELRDLLAAQVDMLAAAQQPDGAWPITWSWGAYLEEWAVARNWWRSHAIIETRRLTQTTA